MIKIMIFGIAFISVIASFYFCRFAETTIRFIAEKIQNTAWIIMLMLVIVLGGDK